MIIQAVRENMLAEVLVIAAGLSVQDPRERPVDQKEAAEQAHRRFANPDSDFLSLLSIWNAYHDEFERLKTQSLVRRFCRSHFLSYTRMREWVDIHAQLEDALENVDFTSIGDTITHIKAPPQPDPNRRIDPAIYSGIHRSILSGLLAHIANRQEKNIYCATGNREAMIFPGSNLFDKNVSKQKDAQQKPSARDDRTEKTFQPKWIVSGEIVETSRLFARTNARIDPLWIVQLGEHICKFTYHAPHWSAQQGRVLVTEKVLLGGLEIHNRLVPYGKVNPREATEIFIRCALVDEPISAPHRFLAENQKLREKVETWQTRLRSTALPNVDEALYRFYTRRIENISSIHDLNRFVREEGKSDRNFLCATESDLIGERDLKLDETSFPESLEIHGRHIPLQYAYAPGEEHDGVTALIPVTLVQHLRPGALEWAVPGWREEQIRNLLKALPKSLRVPLMPLEPKVAEICRNLKPDADSLLQSLSEHIQKHYKVQVTPASWQSDALPAHLKPRVQVTGPENKPLATSRDLSSLKSKLRDAEQKVESNAWDTAAARFERYDLETWDFGDLPAQIELPSRSGLPLLAYPGLQVEGGDVSLRLFRNRDQAIQSSQAGLNRLAELALAKELAWLQKDLRALNSVKDLYITLGSGDELIESAFIGIRNFLFSHDSIYPLTRAAFDQLVATAKERLPGFLHTFTTLATEILRRRQEILLTKKQYPGMRQDLDRLVPPRFLAVIPWPRLQQFPRYLKALQMRAERWATNPVKDQEKARQILPYQQRLASLSTRKDLSADQLRAREELRWLVEELKVSLYAQELGTAVPISPKRVDRFIEEHRL
jgi:ATP-dependent helicase HrpA